MNKNIPLLLETLKSLNCETERSQDALSRTFDTCLKLNDLIEDCYVPSNENVYQEAVKTCINYLEMCTHMVNELDLFSSNEGIEEVQTSNIRYLLLPALLGNLSLAQQSKEFSERIEFLQIAEVYFKDFVLRCKNYELSKRNLIKTYEDELLEEEDSNERISNKRSTLDLAALRESKIRQYKLRKELKDRENELKPALERPDADKSVREYYLVIVERWILTAVEELNNIKSEKSVLGAMIAKEDSSKSVTFKPAEIKPLKPIIITRNEIQKKVFGLGYPSIPVLTIDDFYRQRFANMVTEHKNSEKSMQDVAMAGGNSSKEKEEIEKEILLEKDDLDALTKARDWDEWKDDNPRGSGNRKNKG